MVVNFDRHAEGFNPLCGDRLTLFVKLDGNRNAVANIYLTEVTKAADGSLYNKVVKVVPNVNQMLGLSRAEFDKMGLGSRDVPDCRK